MPGLNYGITRNEIIIIVQLTDKPRVYSSRATISGSLESPESLRAESFLDF